MGCLSDALKAGVFNVVERGATGGGTMPVERPHYHHVYLTLLEVALALKYLHSIHLVHRVRGWVGGVRPRRFRRMWSIGGMGWDGMGWVHLMHEDCSSMQHAACSAR